MDPKHSMANAAMFVLESHGDTVARPDESRKEKAVKNLETAISKQIA